jgi:ABC-2 type transport system ATP-binding protein
MATEVLIAAHHLTRFYGHNCVVRDVSFQLTKGEVLGFLGPNGAGKSTTMRMLTGNLAPSAGRIRVAGIDLLDAPRQAKARIGYLPEQPPLYRELTVTEYLRYCAHLHRVPGREVSRAVDRAQARCGLTEMRRRLIGNLSKGYQQRVGIAQAILHDPAVVILDEPTVGLDPIQIREIRDLIRELGENHGIILSTHILPEVQTICSRVQIIHRGRMVFAATLAELQQQMTTQSLLLGCHAPPSLQTLEQLPGVSRVTPLAEGRFRVAFDAENPAETLAARAVAEGWRLYELSPEKRSLEQIFVELTTREPEAEAA